MTFQLSNETVYKAYLRSAKEYGIDPMSYDVWLSNGNGKMAEKLNEPEYGMEMPVWIVEFKGFNGYMIIRVGDWEGLQGAFETVYNDDLEAMTNTEYFDPTSEKVTITVKYMHVAEFEALEPFEP